MDLLLLVINHVFLYGTFSDDTPHVADKNLGEDTVLKIIGNLTHLIQGVFPGMRQNIKS